MQKRRDYVIIDKTSGGPLAFWQRTLSNMEVANMNGIIDAINKENQKASIPSFNVGDTVKVSVKVIEGNRERIQAFEGVCISKNGGGISETFTVRRLSFGVGVERTFPIHSPKVADVQVVRKGKVNRAKLYYLRGRTGKAAKIKEVK